MAHDMDAVLERIRNTISEAGHAVQYVAGDPPWAYTIGLTGRGLPELILFGLDPRSSQWILNEAAELLLAGKLHAGTPFSFSEETAPLMPLQVRTGELSNEWFAIARRFFPLPRLQALQLVISDPQHRFPWDARVNPRYREVQPLLGDPPSDRPLQA